MRVFLEEVYACRCAGGGCPLPLKSRAVPLHTCWGAGALQWPGLSRTPAPCRCSGAVEAIPPGTPGRAARWGVLTPEQQGEAVQLADALGAEAVLRAWDDLLSQQESPDLASPLPPAAAGSAAAAPPRARLLLLDRFQSQLPQAYAAALGAASKSLACGASAHKDVAALVAQLSPASGAALFRALGSRLAAEEAAHKTTRQALAAASLAIDMPPSDGSRGGSARLLRAKSALHGCASGCATALVGPERPLLAVPAVLLLSPVALLLALLLSPIFACLVLVTFLPQKWFWWLPERLVDFFDANN